MPRQARIVVPGLPHHITQRGNDKRLTFIDDEDYAEYLYTLEHYKNKFKLDIFVYSLMPNHVHVEGSPGLSDSLAKTFNYALMCYTQYFNKKYSHVGHLWQSRFFSCALDIDHSYSTAKYIELNPVKAGLVASPDQWIWSSAKEHLGLGKGIISLSPINKIIEVRDWKEFLMQDVADNERTIIDKHLKSGLPLGNDNFIDTLEKILGRKLKPKLSGRPCKGNVLLF